jgi:hypothetical protein
LFAQILYLFQAEGKDKGKEKDNNAPVSLNRAAVLAEIERIGTGLVKKITIHS